MIIKNKYNKKVLTKTADTITYKKHFIKRTINISEIKSIYITNKNHLNILTHSNTYFEKHIWFPNESTLQLLKELVKSINSEHVIVGTDFFKYNTAFVILYWLIIFNGFYPDKYRFILTCSILLLYFIIYIFGKITQIYYLYNVDLCTVSTEKGDKIISVFNFKDCIYKKLTLYNSNKEYIYKKQHIFFPNTITFPIEYHYALKKSK